MSSNAVTVAILGAGGRGFCLAEEFGRVPHLAKVVAVAEPRDDYRAEFAQRFAIPPQNAFADWRQFVERTRFCDAVVIAMGERRHADPAVACTELGYHMLLEKPMAATVQDCQRIVDAQRRADTITCVCHSLRYAKPFALLKDLVSSGRVGRIVTIDQMEQVVWWHQALGFVRGKWRNEEESAPMLLTKSCHDLDYIAYLVGADCQRISSFGRLSYFTPQNAPRGSGERCVSCGVEAECPYSAIKRYVDADRSHWEAASVSLSHDRESHWRAIEAGPYGRCVWRCDNDVVDHQVVAMEFADGVTATFTMTAFTNAGGRRIRVHGTDGEIAFSEEELHVTSFADGNDVRIGVSPEPGSHGGGDARVISHFLRAVRTGDVRQVVTDVRDSFKTHCMVFAAEQSRRERRTVELSEFSRR